jgi:hypothetical protein
VTLSPGRDIDYLLRESIKSNNVHAVFLLERFLLPVLAHAVTVLVNKKKRRKTTKNYIPG